MSEFFASFPRPCPSLFSPRCCHFRHCPHCCRHRRCCHRCRRHHWVVVHHVNHCHCHPLRLPLNPCSLLLPPCHRTLPPPSNSVFIVHRAHHCRLPSPLAHCRHLPPLLLNAIFANFTSPPQLNALKHCHLIKRPCSLPLSCITTIKHCHSQTPTPDTNTCHIQTLMPATTMQGCAMPPEILVPLSSRPWTLMMLFRDNVSCPPSSSSSPPIRVTHLLPSIAVSSPCWLLNMLFANFGTFILALTPLSPSIYPLNICCCVVRTWTNGLLWDDEKSRGRKIVFCEKMKNVTILPH